MKAKTVFVSGGGRGIGAACVKRFYEAGYNVVTTSRTRSELEATVRGIENDPERKILFEAGDVSDEAFVRKFFHQAVQRFGAVHVLINNAAVLVAKKFQETTSEEWNRTMEVNL